MVGLYFFARISVVFMKKVSGCQEEHMVLDLIAKPPIPAENFLNCGDQRIFRLLLSCDS